MDGRQPWSNDLKIHVTLLALVASMLMLFGLLTVVVANGMVVFWPKDLAWLATKPNNHMVELGTGDQQFLLGKQDKERRLYTANRDLYGLSFQYLNASEVETVAKPTYALKVERTEYGPFLGLPVSYSVGGVESEVFPADAPKEQQKEWFKGLSALMARSKKLHKELQNIQSKDLRRISHRMARLRSKLSGPNGKSPSTVQKWQSELEELSALHDGKVREMEAIRQQLRKRRLTLLSGPATKTLDFESILGLSAPNNMSFVAKSLNYLGNVASTLTENPREANTEGGLFPALVGTFVMTLFMSLLVVPFGVLAAIYLREYAKDGLIVRLVRTSVNNLAGVPSIVFGVFGLGFFVYFLGHYVDVFFFPNKLPTATYGTGGLLWASLTLALLTVPVVIVSTEEGLASVSKGIREGALACGATKWQVIKNIVLPAAAPGILTGLILAVARGAGEVAPLMLVGVVKLAPALPIDGLFPFLHLERKFMHLGFHLYDLGFQSPDSEAALPMVFVTTLVLIMVVVVINLVAILLRDKLRRRYQTASV